LRASSTPVRIIAVGLYTRTVHHRTVDGEANSKPLPERFPPPLPSAEPEQAAHDVPEEVGLRAGRLRAAGEVEHLAVLHAVIGDAVDPAGADPPRATFP